MLVEESIKSAISSIKTNGVRSFLTALAIIIGTAAVIAVIGIGSSAEKALEESIDDLGPRTLSIFPSQRKRGGISSGFNPLVIKDAEALDKNKEHDWLVAPAMSGNRQVKYRNSNMSGEINGYPFKNFQFNLKASISERSPNFNFHLYRSGYDRYNWNITDLKDQKISNLFIQFSYKDLLNISADYNIIDNYTFFKENANQLTNEFQLRRLASPFQASSQIKYLKFKLSSNINFGKFALINTVQYQKKDQGELEFNELLTLNVPEWISRNTIMYSADVFNKSLQIQTGITFNYFTKFYADYYNPLISEFVTQNHTEIGEFPRFDFFFNAKIQQTRVFIKVEHLNSSFTGYDFYSDPFNPYRDMSVRLGLVWNFFS